jgi:hypothetical protein
MGAKKPSVPQWQKEYQEFIQRISSSSPTPNVASDLYTTVMGTLMKQYSEKVSPALQKALTYGEKTQATGAIGDYSNLRDFFQSSLQRNIQSYQQKTAPVAQEVASAVGSPEAYQTFKLATEGSRRFGSQIDFSNIQKSWQEWKENVNKSMAELGIQGFDIEEQFKKWYGG